MGFARAIQPVVPTAPANMGISWCCFLVCPRERARVMEKQDTKCRRSPRAPWGQALLGVLLRGSDCPQQPHGDLTSWARGPQFRTSVCVRLTVSWTLQASPKRGIWQLKFNVKAESAEALSHAAGSPYLCRWK